MSKNPKQSSVTIAAKYPLGYLQTGREDYLFLVVCVIAQAATILITWPLWQVRQEPINLPWVAQTPQFSCGIVLLGSLALVLLSPRKFGLATHLILLLAAITMDQLRCQPQVLCVAALMVGCTWPAFRRLVIWFLISMWLWAGVHKLISPDWFGYTANFLLGPLGISDATTQIWIVGFLAVSEIAVAIAAWWRPRLGAIACVLLHVGISIFLVVIGWNVSVLPWNLCTALVGGWMLWTANGSKDPNGSSVVASLGNLFLPSPLWQRIIVGLMFVVPLAFYTGGVRHCFAHVLYSGNTPKAIITRAEGIEVPATLALLRVPFPRCPKAWRDYFQMTSAPGDKLHVRDPLRKNPDTYFLLNAVRKVEPISADRFYQQKLESVPRTVEGVALDDVRAVLKLARGGVDMRKRSASEMIFAAKFKPEFYSPDLLPLLQGLPNLEELSLEGCDVQDEDLELIPHLRKLYGVVLKGTRVTEQGIAELKRKHNLEVIETD